MNSAEGSIAYSAPQIAERAEPFRSRIRETLRGLTEELEGLAVEMYARGLSTRDIEALFADETGKPLLSRTAVSTITERLWAEYEGFASRDLAEFDVVYLFVDGIAERLHLGQPREAVLAAWGITHGGHKVLLGLAPASKEDTASCRDFLRDLKARGLADPILVASDGAPGLIRAVEDSVPARTTPALPGAQDPQSRGEGARRALARSEGHGAGRLPGCQSHARRALEGGVRETLRARAAVSDCMLSR